MTKFDEELFSSFLDYLQPQYVRYFIVIIAFIFDPVLPLEQLVLCIFYIIMKLFNFEARIASVALETTNMTC